MLDWCMSGMIIKKSSKEWQTVNLIWPTSNLKQAELDHSQVQNYTGVNMKQWDSIK